MNEQSPIEEFARNLVRDVRDRAIQESDRIFDKRDMRGQYWRQIARTQDPHDAILTVIPDVVDKTLMRMLDAIDNGKLLLLFRSETGEVVDLHEEFGGELLGWYAGEDWLQRFSQQRYTGYMDETKFPPPEVPPLRDA